MVWILHARKKYATQTQGCTRKMHLQHFHGNLGSYKKRCNDFSFLLQHTTWRTVVIWFHTWNAFVEHRKECRRTKLRKNRSLWGSTLSSVHFPLVNPSESTAPMLSLVYRPEGWIQLTCRLDTKNLFAVFCIHSTYLDKKSSTVIKPIR